MVYDLYGLSANDVALINDWFQRRSLVKLTYESRGRGACHGKEPGMNSDPKLKNLEFSVSNFGPIVEGETSICGPMTVFVGP